ncbi:MAG: hypothetical protein JWR26_1025 [Pedosphaera sp.]|nr:hypothetical protein [Pedosphaera sp.]
MNIFEATKSYETWLSAQTCLIKPDLQLKHEGMRHDPFVFLRATYYRWAQVWPKVCKGLAADATVMGVGDLHVENFGTWRDVDGRLVWGINDFDECHPMPFTNDLVRLATSAYLAVGTNAMAIKPKSASTAILEGYRAGLACGGRPFVLVDKSTPLRVMARERLDAPEKFWEKLRSHPPVKGSVPAKAARAIRELLPDKSVSLKFLHRIAGMGSLGKQRFTGVGTWLGGLIAREAKALTPSAYCWAAGKKNKGVIHYDWLLRNAVRCPDPLVIVRGEWLIRRLSPDCFKIRLINLPERPDEKQLLYSMGWETANVHLGSAKAANLSTHLKGKRSGWLHEAAKAMSLETFRDFKEWRKKSRT